MSDKKKRPNRREKHRASTRPSGGGPPRSAPVFGTAEVPAELLETIDRALADPHPLALLALASAIVAVREPRIAEPGSSSDEPTLGDACEAFDKAGLRQTDALLRVMTAMAGDDLLRERIRRKVAGRRHAIPGWVIRLDEIRPTRAVAMVHVLGDGDDIVIGVDLPGNRRMSILVYIDHNMGTIVKDAFALDVPLDEVVAAWNELGASNGAVDGDAPVLELSLADARARITPAIDEGALFLPPLQSDTWPMSRPLVEWIISMLPEGGADYERPEWSERKIDALTEDFFASEFGRPVDDAARRSLLDGILWFATSQGPGDPLRWSPVAVEMLLIGFLPRKIVAEPEFLTQAPGLLRAFISYAHAERGIRPGLTQETIQAVDFWEPEYLAAIGESPSGRPLDLVERIGALDGVDPELLDGPDHDGLDPDDFFLALLASEVGGAAALQRLDAVPLPDEPFAWSGIPEDTHGRVGEVLALVDGCAGALFDTEFRTGVRRFLARVAAADPAIFRGRSQAKTLAATVCWVIGKANERFEPEATPRVTVKMLTEHFGGGGSFTRRADPLLRALGLTGAIAWQWLGDGGLLDSARRASIIEERDAYANDLDDFDDYYDLD